MQAAGVAVRKWNVAQGIEARQGGDANAAPCEAQEPGPEGMRPNTPSTTTVETLVKALEKAATRFRIYAEMHRGKKTEEGDAKAIANDLMAEECEAALTSYRSELGGKQS
jgi:hypothetical protein